MGQISIIVPIYKVEYYLRQCVDSILVQTFQDFELILVDDGSPDGCPAICDEYAEKDPRVRVIHKENGGLSSARNAGLDIAQGKYVFFVDSDDWLRPDALQLLIQEQQQTGANMVICNVEPSYPEVYTGSRRKTVEMKKETLSQEEMADCIAREQNWIYVVAWNKLYNRSIWDDLRFPEGCIHEDEAVIHRIIGKCGIIAVLPEKLYFYRQNTGGITAQGLRIQTTDKLAAYVDRILYASEKGWTELVCTSAAAYVHAFLNLYFRFQRTEDAERYFCRMDEELKAVLPYILRCKNVSLRQKVYLLLICINPNLYTALKKPKQ